MESCLKYSRKNYYKSAIPLRNSCFTFAQSFEQWYAQIYTPHFLNKYTHAPLSEHSLHNRCVKCTRSRDMHEEIPSDYSNPTHYITIIVLNFTYL